MSKPTIEHLVRDLALQFGEAFALMQQQLDNLQKQVTLLGSHAFPSAPSDDECDEIDSMPLTEPERDLALQFGYDFATGSLSRAEESVKRISKLKDDILQETEDESLALDRELRKMNINPQTFGKETYEKS